MQESLRSIYVRAFYLLRDVCNDVLKGSDLVNSDDFQTILKSRKKVLLFFCLLYLSDVSDGSVITFRA